MNQTIFGFTELFIDIVEAFVIMFYFAIFLGEDHLLKKHRAIVIASFAMGILCFSMENTSLISIVKTCIFWTLYVIICTKLYNSKLIKSILCMLSLIAIMLVLEIGTISLLQLIFHEKFRIFLEYGLERLIMTTIIKVLEIVAVIIFNKVRKRHDKVALDKKMFALSTVLVIPLVILLAITGANCINGELYTALVICIIFVSIGFMFFILYTMLVLNELLRSKQELKLIQMKNDMLSQSMKESAASFDHWEKSIHDYKNIMITLGGMLEKENGSQAYEYINKELEHMTHTGHIIHSGNDTADTLLSMKWMDTEKKGIYFSVQGNIPNNIPMTDMDLGRVLGNITDNAIEAAEKVKESPFVEVRFSSKEDLFFISVMNNTVEKNIDFSKTAKENKEAHGIGLRSATAIVESYEGTIKMEKNWDVVECKICIPHK